MNHLDIAVNILYFEEGYREHPYYCSEGYPTIGIGQKIGPKNAPLEFYTFSVTPYLAKEWCKSNIGHIDGQLTSKPFYTKLSDNRTAVIISMCYQLGVVGVMKFKKMLAALEVEDYEEAARQALDSKWARQTPKRAKRHAEVLRTDKLQDIY